ncbi:hypothetical protein Aduo_001634 [Ancylostoma duodenale]
MSDKTCCLPHGAIQALSRIRLPQLLHKSLAIVHEPDCAKRKANDKDKPTEETVPLGHARTSLKEVPAHRPAQGSPYDYAYSCIFKGSSYQNGKVEVKIDLAFVAIFATVELL